MLYHSVYKKDDTIIIQSKQEEEPEEIIARSSSPAKSSGDRNSAVIDPSILPILAVTETPASQECESVALSSGEAEEMKALMALSEKVGGAGRYV